MCVLFGVFITLTINLYRVSRRFEKMALQALAVDYRQYLKSDAWKRKRYVVLKRDNWTCQSCGAKATQVHHMKYAKYKIGKEPIKWLVSLCASCHHKIHN